MTAPKLDWEKIEDEVATWIYAQGKEYLNLKVLWKKIIEVVEREIENGKRD